ncbi:MAG: hypothetical protein OSB62_05380 [Alphaproteobacteria bacterium]|nr:hypothetical protein [Alphaproteobacteria bacterium]
MIKTMIQKTQAAKVCVETLQKWAEAQHKKNMEELPSALKYWFQLQMRLGLALSFVVAIGIIVFMPAGEIQNITVLSAEQVNGSEYALAVTNGQDKWIMLYEVQELSLKLD